MTPAQTPTPGNWLSLAALIMLWGTSFMFISLSLESFSPVGIVSMRVLLAAVVLTVFMYIRGLRLPATGLAWSIFLLFGIVGNLLPFYLISVGQKEVSSGIAGLLMAVMPLATMVLAHYFVAGERLNRFKIMGFMLGISGVAIILWPSIVGSHSDLLSSLLILLAALCYALNTILVRRLPAFNPIVTGSGVMLISSLIMVPFWLLTETPLQQDYSLTSLLSVVWLGIGPTGIATLILFAVIASAGPTFISYINYVIPVVAYFTGALILGEALEWRSLGALLLIILGIALTRKRPVY
jgi:drug/metabolite transporter (DMT)-like permease